MAGVGVWVKVANVTRAEAEDRDFLVVRAEQRIKKRQNINRRRGPIECPVGRKNRHHLGVAL